MKSKMCADSAAVFRFFLAVSAASVTAFLLSIFLSDIERKCRMLTVLAPTQCLSRTHNHVHDCGELTIVRGAGTSSGPGENFCYTFFGCDCSMNETMYQAIFHAPSLSRLNSAMKFVLWVISTPARLPSSLYVPR